MVALLQIKTKDDIDFILPENQIVAIIHDNNIETFFIYTTTPLVNPENGQQCYLALKKSDIKEVTGDSYLAKVIRSFLGEEQK